MWCIQHMRTLSMCLWVYSLCSSLMIILSLASTKHKALGKSWHELNADLRSDSEVRETNKRFKYSIVNALCHSPSTPFLSKLWAVLYRHTSCCYSHWQRWKCWSDLHETTSLTVFFFLSSACPHYSVWFQKNIQFSLRGNEELVMVEGGQELIFPLPHSIFLSLPHFFFFNSPLVLAVWAGLSQKRWRKLECQAIAGEWECTGRVDSLFELNKATLQGCVCGFSIGIN